MGISRQLGSSIDKFEVLLLVILFHFIEYLPEPVNDLFFITLIIIIINIQVKIIDTKIILLTVSLLVNYLRTPISMKGSPMALTSALRQLSI